MAVSRHADAEDAYRKAYKLSPNNKRYVELIKSAASMLSKK
jgi:cytochrome c-type biogenesis protein CcmH/NrfG